MSKKKVKYIRFGYALYIKRDNAWQFVQRFTFRKDADAYGVKTGLKFRVEGIKLDATPLPRLGNHEASQQA